MEGLKISPYKPNTLLVKISVTVGEEASTLHHGLIGQLSRFVASVSEMKMYQGNRGC
jgi:hypothetical protein